MACGGCFGFLTGAPRPAAGTNGGSSSASRGPSFRILTANDIYKPDRLAKLRTLVERSTGPCLTKFVLPGDLLGGSLFATAHQGESVIAVLNTMGIDYCTLGNHEFDYGAERTAQLMDESTFPWLGSNIRWTDGRGLFHSTMDLDTFRVPCGGGTCKVGVFGVCTAATPELAQPGPSVVFEDAIAHSRRCVKELQDQGCELILAFTHLTLAQDKRLAEECAGIRAIVGGHDHDPFLLVHHGTLIVKCGQNADHMGVLDFALERSACGTAVKSEYSFGLLPTEGVPPDPRVLAAAAPYIKEGGYDDIVCTVSKAPLNSRSQELRSRESAFGCLVADAIRWSYRNEGCEVAIQNGGFIRQDAEYPPGTELSAGDVREEMPFPRTPKLVELRGEHLRQGLEEMMGSAPVPAGSFPQLSEGFRVVYDASRPRLSKITSIEVLGTPLDPARLYRVAISDFYVDKCGDNVEGFTKGRCLAAHGEIVREVVVKYFRQLGAVSGAAPGRLVERRQR